MQMVTDGDVSQKKKKQQRCFFCLNPTFCFLFHANQDQKCIWKVNGVILISCYLQKQYQGPNICMLTSPVPPQPTSSKHMCLWVWVFLSGAPLHICSREQLQLVWIQRVGLHIQLANMRKHFVFEKRQSDWAIQIDRHGPVATRQTQDNYHRVPVSGRHLAKPSETTCCRWLGKFQLCYSLTLLGFCCRETLA